MTVAGRRVVSFSAIALWVALGCGGSTDDRNVPAPPLPPPEQVFPDTNVDTVEFLPPGSLTMVAGETATLEVQVSPAGVHTVRFALLGKTDDAFLNPSVVETSADGVARTNLTALAAATRFSVRAAASDVSSSLDVVTLEASAASLVITPNYPGSRSVETWTASVHFNVSCSDLLGVPFPDGRLVSSGTPSVRIDGLPAEVPMAVVVRAGQFAGGCRGVTPLRANSETPVTVDVMDRPLQTAELSLRVELGVEPADAPNPALDELAFRAVRPLTGAANDDLAALLDAMSGLASSPAAFEQARAAQGWPAALVAGLPPDLPGTGLRTLIQDWMRTGLDALEAPDALRGTLTSLGEDGSAWLSLQSVIGLAPDSVGFPLENEASAVAETEDFLRIGAAFDFSPSPFLAAAATRAALAQDPERSSAADAMAVQFGCADVAEILVGAGTAPGEAFDGCDDECTEQLCSDAMGVLWTRVAESNLPAVPWQISGASRAQIDDEARPTRVDGRWVGTLNVDTFGNTPIQGPFTGTSNK